MTRPLFPTYLFAQLNASFRKEKIETSRVRLVVFRKKLLTDEHLTIFNEVALAMTIAKGDLEQFRRDRMPKVEARAITPGDIMQILHGAMQGKPVEVLQTRKDEILIGFKEHPDYRPVWISASSLAKAV